MGRLEREEDNYLLLNRIYITKIWLMTHLIKKKLEIEKKKVKESLKDNTRISLKIGGRNADLFVLCFDFFSNSGKE